MGEREEAKENALKLLRSIETIDDLKEHKEEVLSVVEDIFKFSVQSLKNFFEGSLSMEEKQEEIAKFQDEDYLFDKDIEKELDRIADLPGANEYFETFKEELVMRIQPHMDEFAEQMAKFLGDLMSEMMGGIMEGMGDMMGGMGDMMGEMVEGSPEQEDRERSNELSLLYEVQTMEDLKKYKDHVMESIEEQLNYDLCELQDIKALDFPVEEVKDRLEEIEARKTLIESELELEFTRIESIKGVSEHAKSVREEIENRMNPITKEIDELLKDLNKTD